MSRLRRRWLSVRFSVSQDMLVTDVIRIDGDVSVVLVSERERQKVRWSFGDGIVAARHERTLRRWADSATLVTVVTRPGEATVLDERALLARALGPVTSP
jgi:hypothetical protein